MRTLICECGKSFTPIISLSGIVKSKKCSQCMIEREILKRKEKLRPTVSLDVKEAKKALKSKLPKKDSPKPTLRRLIEKLDREFSLYIRQRDSHNGSFVCISCNTPKPYQQADCGHYINRKHLSVRFDEMNCNAQCRHCNRFSEGNMQGYRAGLIRKYGEKSLKQLEVKQSLTRKYSVFELEILIKHYKKLNSDYLLSGELF